MTKRELIAALEALEVPDDTQVRSIRGDLDGEEGCCTAEQPEIGVGVHWAFPNMAAGIWIE
jgi:hypothetical protein